MASRIRLVGRGTLSVQVNGREVEIDGGISFPRDGREGFWLEASKRWRWSDGEPMTEADRERLLESIPRIGEEEGWVLTLDEGPWVPRPPITSLFHFKGHNQLVWTSGSVAVVVPGSFTYEGATPTFAMGMSGGWTRLDGTPLSADEIDETADAIRKARPANGVVTTTAGRPRDHPLTRVTFRDAD